MKVCENQEKTYLNTQSLTSMPFGGPIGISPMTENLHRPCRINTMQKQQ